MKKALITLAVAVIIVTGGYYILAKKPTTSTSTTVGYGSPSATISSTNPPSTPSAYGTPATQSATLNIMTDSSLGTYLVAQNGMTLYKYTPDTPGVSNCTGQCAVNWPPYTVPDPASLSVDPSIKGKISTTKRSDGTSQVTYNDVPLYYYIKDMKPGDTTGQNVGGVWFVVNP